MGVAAARIYSVISSMQMALTGSHSLQCHSHTNGQDLSRQNAWFCWKRCDVQFAARLLNHARTPKRTEGMVL